MNMKPETVIYLQQRAREMYHHKDWGGDFDKYWRGTICNRMDVQIPYSGYWEDKRKIQLATWRDEAIANGVGK